MIYINLIKQVLNCDDAYAYEILGDMGEYRLSSMSNKQLIKAIKSIHETNQLVKGKSTEEIQKLLMKLYGAK
jgi:hypothetical protein